MRIWLRDAGVLLAAVGLAGCVSLPPNAKPSPHDPWERFNRGVYKFNTVLDRTVAKPVAKTYVKITPRPIRTGVSNFMANFRMPDTMINDALQGKFKAAWVDLGRMLMNTTLGFGGLFDPATRAGLDHNDEDFGQTLGFWGLPAGPFLELPLFGPSDLRDAPCRLADSAADPAFFTNRAFSWSYSVIDLVDIRTGLLSLDPAVDSAFDPYAFVRDAYVQNRQYKVLDGNVPDEPLEDPDAPAREPAPAK